MLRIMLVEDSAADVFMIKESLNEAGLQYEAIVLGDGEDALISLRDTAKPDLIVIDLNLPKIDGYEVVESVRGNPNLADIPVVVLSSSSLPFDRQRAEGLGRTRYISKPITLDEFMAIGREIRDFYDRYR
jgi:CheY-like chemotaxis protein